MVKKVTKNLRSIITHEILIKLTDIQEEVWTTVLSYSKLIHEGKVNEFLKFIHEDYSGWNNVEPIPVDRQSIINELNDEKPKVQKGRYKIVPVRIIVHNEVAIVQYYYFSFGSGNIKTSNNKNRKHHTDVLIKEGGKWILIADHFCIKKNKII